MSNLKILTKPFTGKFELEKIGNKWVVFEYETDYWEDNLELNEEEKDMFVKDWVKQDYKLNK